MFERRHPFVTVVFCCLAIFAVADDRSLVAVIFFIRFQSDLAVNFKQTTKRD